MYFDGSNQYNSFGMMNENAFLNSNQMESDQQQTSSSRTANDLLFQSVDQFSQSNGHSIPLTNQNEQSDDFFGNSHLQNASSSIIQNHHYLHQQQLQQPQQQQQSPRQRSSFVVTSMQPQTLMIANSLFSQTQQQTQTQSPQRIPLPTTPSKIITTHPSMQTTTPPLVNANHQILNPMLLNQTSQISNHQILNPSLNSNNNQNTNSVLNSNQQSINQIPKQTQTPTPTPTPTPSPSIQTTIPPKTTTTTKPETILCPLCNQKLSKESFEKHFKSELEKMQDWDITEATSSNNNAKIMNETLNSSSEQSETQLPEQTRTKREAAIHARKKVQSSMHAFQRSNDEEPQSALKQIRENFSKRSDRRNANNQNNSSNSNSSNNTTTSTTTTSSNTTPKQQRQPRKKSSNSKNASQQAANNNKPICPICSLHIGGDMDDVNIHIDQCLRKQQRTEATNHTSRRRSRNNNQSTANSILNSTTTTVLESNNQTSNNQTQQQRQQQQNNEVQSDSEEGEEITWAGHTFIRTGSLVQKSNANKPKPKEVEDDEDLDILDDDTASRFGKAQYSEADLITGDIEEEEKTLRERLLERSDNVEKSKKQDQESSKPTIATKSTNSNPNTHNVTNFRCLVCLDVYQKPLVSVNCWHVYCEQCWLQTLGAKRLCPQCLTITSAADLRKIYL